MKQKKRIPYRVDGSIAQRRIKLPKMSKLEAIRNNTTPQRTNNASADGPAVKRKNKNIGFDTMKTKSM